MIGNMWLPVVFALAVPTSFAHTVQTRAAADHMRLIEWWADDLDGDHVNESIAFLCNDEEGEFLVQHGNDLLEAGKEIDGRNSCPDAPAAPPAWRVEKSGVISRSTNVHHGDAGDELAIRDGQLVIVRQGGGEHDTTVEADESDRIDYDALTWSHSEDRHGRTKRTSGPLVVVTDKVRRSSKLIGASTLAATRVDDSTMTLHVHAARALVIRDCSRRPCKKIQVAKGDHELAIATASELEIMSGKTKLTVHFEMLEGEGSYPSP